MFSAVLKMLSKYIRARKIKQLKIRREKRMDSDPVTYFKLNSNVPLANKENAYRTRDVTIKPIPL